MQRDLISEIHQWNGRRKRKPLVLMGARQVGKTWLMDEFAQQTYGENVVSVNFMRKQSLCRTLKDTDIDPAGLLKLLQAASGKRIVPGRTLLILDEIQECPSALTSLKFFQEDLPELAVMAAGSLLGLSYGGVSWGYGENDEAKGSFPVGKVDRLNVYPMSFAEFLDANGKSVLREAIDTGDWRTVGLLASECESLLKQYFVVGGMPEAVSDWVETGDLPLANIKRSVEALLNA